MKVLQDFLDKLNEAILTPILTLIVIVAVVIFLYGVMQFVISAGDEEARTTGKQHMIWGIIGLAIIFGANAIIQLIKNTVGAP